MTRTLKEVLTENDVEPFNKDDCFSRDRQDAFLSAVREWLTEKHAGTLFGDERKTIAKLLEEF